MRLTVRYRKVENNKRRHRQAGGGGGLARKLYRIFLRLCLYGFFVYLLFVLLQQQISINRLKRQEAELAAEIQAARQRSQGLRAQLRAQQADAFVEKVAREELGLTRAGEIVLIPVPKD